jgi:hypothetical protein
MNIFKTIIYRLTRLTMNLRFIVSLFIISGIGTSSIINAQNYYELWAKDNKAVIVVTGLKLRMEESTPVVEDVAAAKSALVTLTSQSGHSVTKTTQAFSREFSSGGTYYSADFPVVFDSIYDISIQFSNGTIIRINDYQLPGNWKTHHYFHSTTGKKSAASVLRKEKDENSDLWCFVYSLYPQSNYETIGGTQILSTDEP